MFLSGKHSTEVFFKVSEEREQENQVVEMPEKRARQDINIYRAEKDVLTTDHFAVDVFVGKASIY